MQNRFLKTLLLTASLVLPAASHAYSISASFASVAAGGKVYRTVNSATGRVSGGQMLFENVQTDFPDQIGLNSLYGWCIEPGEYINYDITEWEIVDLADGNNSVGGIGTQRANYLRELFHFVMPDFSQLTDTRTGLALQIASWEIVTDSALGNFDLTGGDMRFGSTNPDGAVVLAQSWLDAVVNNGVQDAMLDNLYAATRDGKQDMIFQFISPSLQPADDPSPVPLPAPLWLLLCGTAIMMLRRRRS